MNRKKNSKFLLRLTEMRFSSLQGIVTVKIIVIIIIIIKKKNRKSFNYQQNKQ